MTRFEFLQRLERALRQLPDSKRAEIVADYQSYFADGVAAGRSEEAVAESLGDPARLGAELVVAHEAASLDTAVAPTATLRTLKALSALVVLDRAAAWLLLVACLPAILLLLMAGCAALLYGLFMLVVGPFDMPLGGVVAALLRGVGWVSAGIAALALARAVVYSVATFFLKLNRHNRRAQRHANEVFP